MKYGFMLIELIVATLIASMIGTLLLTALSQGTRFQRAIDMMVDTSLRVGIASHQLEKDFMGAFIPTQAHVEEESEEKETAEKAGSEKKEDKQPQKKEVDQEKDAKTSQEPSIKEKKPAEKPIEKIFYGTAKDGHLDILTFITNNPLTVFVGKDVGVVKPKVVRVQYSLKPEDEKEKKSDTFVLMRQESTELDLAKYTNVRSYELIGGIKECTITYTARIKKEDEQAKKAAAKTGEEKAAAGAQKEKVQYEYKTMPEWVSERKEETAKKQEEQKEAEFPRIPYMIEIKMSLWDMQHDKTEECVLTFMLPTDFSPQKKEKKEEKKEAKKKDTKEKEADGKGSEEKSNDLMSSLSKNLGNITKIFSKM